MKRRRVVVIIVALLVAFAAGDAWATNPFTDVAGNTHAADIDAIYAAGITSGCSATTYCPNDPVTRAQMATFLARVAAVSSGATKHFPLTNGRSPQQVYCSLAAANPVSLAQGPCRADTLSVDSFSSHRGQDNAVAIGADGYPIIVDHSLGSGEMDVVHCLDVACSGHEIAIAESDGAKTQLYPQIAIGVDGLPVISYSSTGLWVLHCADIACKATPTITEVDSNPNAGPFDAIAIGADGLPVISYYDDANKHPTVAHCANVACTASTRHSLDTAEAAGTYTSIAIGTDGNPFVTYHDFTEVGAGTLRAAHCTAVDCSTSVIKTLNDDGDTGSFTSVAMGVDGNPIVSYRNITAADLEVLHCSNLACDTVTSTKIEPADATGDGSRIAIGTDGRAVIAYLDGATNVHIAHCATLDCSTSTVTAVASGIQLALASGIDGLPVVAYHCGVPLVGLCVSRVPVG